MDCSMPGFPVIANSLSLLKLMSIESVMPSNHFILCCPLLLLPSIFPSIRVFSNESALHIRWQKSWSLFKLTSIESVMPSNHLILCHPLLLPPSIFPSIRVFSNESVLLDYHRIPDLSSLNLCHTANFHWLSSLLTVYVSMLRWH